MWAVLKTFAVDNALRIAGYATLALTLLGIILGIRKSGRDAERVENLENRVERVKDANKIENKVDRLPDGAALDELRNDWSRKGE